MRAPLKGSDRSWPSGLIKWFYAISADLEPIATAVVGAHVLPRRHAAEVQDRRSVVGNVIVLCWFH